MKPLGSVRSRRIYQNQQVNSLPFCVKLPGHFIGQKAPIAKASQQVWTLWLNRTQRPNMSCCHSFESERDLHTIKFIGFQDVKWLIRSQTACQLQGIEAATIPIAV